MKALIVFNVIFILSSVNAQDGIEAYVFDYNFANYVGAVSPLDFDTHDFSGEQLSFIPTTPVDFSMISIAFLNNTGATQNWIVSRRRIFQANNWYDYMTWQHETDPFGGLCISSAAMDTPLFIMPGAGNVTANQGEQAIVTSYINIDPLIGGCSHYRYYLGTEVDPFIDSVDIELCYTLGVEEKSDLSFSFYPNPVENILMVDGSKNSTIAIYNSSFKTILEDLVILPGVNLIDFSYLSSGVYFIKEEERIQRFIKR